jgi:hypothetical protein
MGYSYNSVVFSSVSVFDYGILHISEQAMQLNTTSEMLTTDQKRATNAIRDLMLSQNVVRMENRECSNAYSQEFQTSHGNLALVTSENVRVQIDNRTFNWQDQAEYFSGDDLLRTFGDKSNSWRCNDRRNRYTSTKIERCNLLSSPTKSALEGWEPMDRRVLYCLSEKVEQHCKLRFSISLASIVITINVIKVIILMIAAFGMKETPILTMGDAVSSFLTKPDVETKEMCLTTKYDISRSRGNWDKRLTTFQQKRDRWFRSVGLRRWTFSMSLLVHPKRISHNSNYPVPITDHDYTAVCSS